MSENIETIPLQAVEVLQQKYLPKKSQNKRHFLKGFKLHSKISKIAKYEVNYRPKTGVMI